MGQEKDMTDKLRFGYFVPEFPCFSQIFFWRELKVLGQEGVDARIFSTRPPSHNNAGNSAWVKEVAPRVSYLMPLSPKDVLEGVVEAIRTPFWRWFMAFKIILTAKDVDFRQRVELIPALILGLKFKRLARQQKLQHLHSHFVYNGANLVMFASILAGIPYSISWHGPFWGHGNQRNKWRLAKFGIAITEDGKTQIAKTIGEEYLPKKFMIAPMGVDPSEFQRKTDYKPYQGEGAFKLFSCGRLCGHKGHDYVVDAVHALVQRGYEVQLRIAGSEVGGDSYTKALQTKVENLGLANSVTLLGAIDGAQVKKELEDAHAFVLASFEEPFGVVYAEAMAMELPTIGTDAGGVPEIITHLEDGMMVPPQSLNPLVEMLDRIGSQPELAVRMGAKGRVKVINNFSVTRSANCLIRGIQES